MSDIVFTVGVFRDFKATVTFHLGKIQQDVKKDTVVQFDGTTIRIDGVPHPYPEIRSTIKAGWLVLLGSNVSDYVPQSANVKVRPAVDGGSKGRTASTTVQKDETFVSPVHKTPPVTTTTTTEGVQIQTKKFNPTLIRDTEGDGRTVGPAVRKTASESASASSDGEAVARIKTPAKRSFSVDGSTSMNVDTDTVEAGIHQVTEPVVAAKTNEDPKREEGLREGQSSETGKVIANLKTSTRRKVVVTDADTATAEIHKLDNAPPVALAPKGKLDIVAMAGDKLEEILPANEPENRAALLAEQTRAQRLAAVKAASAKVKAPASEPDPVATDPPPQPPVKVTPPKVRAKTPQSVEDFAVNGDDLEIAPGIRWNKKVSWKMRVKQALQYRSQPEVMTLIRAYETPVVVKGIDAALGK